MGAVIPLFATARRVNTFRDNRREARTAAQLAERPLSARQRTRLRPREESRAPAHRAVRAVPRPLQEPSLLQQTVLARDAPPARSSSGPASAMQRAGSGSRSVSA